MFRCSTGIAMMPQVPPLRPRRQPSVPPRFALRSERPVSVTDTTLPSPAPRLPLNVYLLMCAQALAGAIPPIMVSLGGVIGSVLAPSPIWATLPVSTFMIGTCLATIPVSLLVRIYGRRPIYLIGALIATCGAAICAFGVMQGSFAILCMGSFLFGLNIACVQSYRFAAGQAVAHQMRARAVSMVLLGGLGSAVIGPQIAIHSGQFSLGVPYASAFAGQAALAAATLPFLFFLRLPGGHGLRHERAAGGGARRLPVTRSYLIAVLCGAFAYGSMTFTMTAAPLAIMACGFGGEAAALGIQWHIMGMFAPSFFTGRLIERFGHLPVMVLGIVIVTIGAIIALTGEELAQFWTTLVLLGVGWNFAYTGSTVMIARASADAGSVALQGLGDFLIFLFVAGASLFAGALFHLSSWAAINITVMIALGLVLALVWSDHLRAGRSRA